MAGLGGVWWHYDSATGEIRQSIIEPGTEGDVAIAALADVGVDEMSLKALAAYTGVAKARADLRTLRDPVAPASQWPLCQKHSDLADEALGMILDGEDADMDDPRVSKALLDRTERALAEYFRLSAEG